MRTASRCPPTPSSRTTAARSAGAGSTAASTPTGSTRPPGASPARGRTGLTTKGGWAGPATRRVRKNRASSAPEGKPWSERKALVWWDEDTQKWTGHDIADLVANRPPSYRPEEGATGVAAIAGDDAFIMQADGKAWLFAPAGRG